MGSDPGFYFWVLLAFFAASLVFLRTFIKERKTLGALAYFSPAFGFYVVYIICFVVRPVALRTGSLVGYADSPEQFEQFRAVLLLSLAGVMAFYLTFDPPIRLRKAMSFRLLPRSSWHGRPGPRRLAAIGTALLLLSMVCTTVFLTLVYQLGAITSDFGVNRALFSAGTAGQGHLFLINTTAAVALLMALYLRSYHQTPLSLKPMLAAGYFFLPNLIVTNRFLITAVLAALLICRLQYARGKGLQMPSRSILIFLASVAMMGSVLGMIRGFGEYQFDDTNSASPLIFFLWTFDMSELLSRTVENTINFDFGQIWLEDLLYLYVPRAIWSAKPQIYGAIQAQAVIFPELIPIDGIPIATYPIGIFGEGYFTFGIAGVVLALAIAGWLLRKLFGSIRDLRQRRPYVGALLFPVFVLQCLNPLGYYRSLGWFMSLVVFHVLVSTIVFGISFAVSRRPAARIAQSRQTVLRGPAGSA